MSKRPGKSLNQGSWAALGALACVLSSLLALQLVLTGNRAAGATLPTLTAAAPLASAASATPGPCQALIAYLPLAANLVDPPAPTATATPTSQPGPPQLMKPANCALLPQPVPPNAWHFEWEGCSFPVCEVSLYLSGPGGREIARTNLPSNSYTYTTANYLPGDALGPWYWSVSVRRIGGSNTSESRRFQVMPPPLPTP